VASWNSSLFVSAMPHTPLLRILDASLNRAGEGLRVVEDFVRFVLDDPFLTSELKSIRHELTTASAAISSPDRYSARDTLRDVGTIVTTPSEQNRADTWAVCAASLKRTEQSLRSLEEYGKVSDADFAQKCELLRYRLYTLEKSIDIGRSSRQRLEGIQLCVLVDGQSSAADFETLVEAFVEVGVGMIQLRDKTLTDRELLLRAWQLRLVTRGTGTLAVINDRADVAAAIRADGVHLGQDDLPVKEARMVVGTEMLIGVSTHHLDQAQAAVLAGANYLGAGPTFPSQTKSFAAFAGLDYLKQLADEIRLPIFAIGGISPENVPQVLETGVSRVAVGAAITATKQPASAARELLSMLNASAE
jgi:thiamine-phosphate pyrophosphorylase